MTCFSSSYCGVAPTISDRGICLLGISSFAAETPHESMYCARNGGFQHIMGIRCGGSSTCIACISKGHFSCSRPNLLLAPCHAQVVCISLKRLRIQRSHDSHNHRPHQVPPLRLDSRHKVFENAALQRCVILATIQVEPFLRVTETKFAAERMGNASNHATLEVAPPRAAEVRRHIIFITIVHALTAVLIYFALWYQPSRLNA